ncbi:potassium channel family protein [Aquipuribacter sp. SD81]|uniref:potassium channel family protein n=1 Tax=Aquipuribacter sp. SD81 TaxID=3127703 RepID=UPI00301B3CFF
MSTAAQVVLTVLGAVTVAAVLRDIFLTIFHPSGQGRVATAVLRGTWAVTGLRDGRLRRVSGPAGLVLVIVAWTGGTALGWSLVYLPHVPEGLSYGPTLLSDLRSQVVDAAYFSLVTLATLGYGDLVPQQAWLRLVAPLQALTGFALITAAVSWVQQVYPALGRRRALAVRLDGLRSCAAADRVARLEGTAALGLLEPLSGELARVQVDLVQHPESYFFQDATDDESLAATVGYVPALARAARHAPAEETRLAGELLERSADGLARALVDQGLLRRHVEGTGEDGAVAARDVFRAYAVDHGRAG